ARFSFLLSTPITAAAAAKAVYDLYKHGGVPAGEQLAFGVGILISGITGSVVIAFLLRFLRTNTFRVFVVYRIAFGALILALAFFVKQP
ncbi:MAG TPA: undecaprenyl-diphosphate phosphatase, partial [Bryobacteraceae bacterium]|nr:undecaprenyl-diphosphate phosphatase [Bryobacteraceae bacterium]